LTLLTVEAAKLNRDVASAAQQGTSRGLTPRRSATTGRDAIALCANPSAVTQRLTRTRPR
jgi:hypothetical protein